jgi:hypothetical protein
MGNGSLNPNEAITSSPPSLLDQRIESQPGWPMGATLFACAGCALVVLSIVQATSGWALAAVPFVAIALVLLVMRPRRLILQLRNDRIQIEARNLFIPYADIEALKASKRPPDWTVPGPRRYPIQVIHRDGVLCVPGRLSVPSDEVFHSLIRKLKPSGSRQVAPLLVDYFDRMVDRYGPEKVLTFRARTFSGQDASYRRACMCSLAVALTGLLWIAFGSQVSGYGWVPFGFLLLFAGGLFSALFGFEGRVKKVGAKFRSASLVIAPPGLAMVQGDVQGEMRWHELRKVEWKKQAAGTSSSERFHGAILLKFAGAQIAIGDVYDRPLTMIYRTVQDYWREEKELDAAGQRKLDA